MVKDERYVDFNGKPLNGLRYVFCELLVNYSYLSKAKNGTKSVIGREWQSTLRYKLVPEGELKLNSAGKETEPSAETKQFVVEFPTLFERRGKLKCHQVRINF